MFEKPTIEDFVERIDWHISTALERAGRSVAQVRADATKHGAFQGSRRVLYSIEAARTEFDAGIEAVLGELKRAIRDTSLEPKVLREQTERRLKNFAEDAKVAAQASDLVGADFRKQLAAFDQHLQFALRQFDVGLRDPSEPEVPPVTKNTITVGNMTGNIQQNSPGATQTFEFKLNIEAAQTALHTFESELSKNEIDDRAKQELTLPR